MTPKYIYLYFRFQKLYVSHIYFISMGDGTRVIGLGYPKFANGGLEWPPYSPDFFLWSYITDKCYAENPTTRKELIEAIKVAYGFTVDMLEKVSY